MDHNKRKLLTQSTPFIMSNLTPNNEMIDAFKKENVLTHEESNNILRDDSTAGKCLLLIVYVRQKENNIWSRFLSILEQFGGGCISTMLRSKSTASEVVLPDRRTMAILDQYLNKCNLPHKVIKELACKVVSKEVYHDDVSTLQERVVNLQKSLRQSQSGPGVIIPTFSRTDSNLSTDVNNDRNGTCSIASSDDHDSETNMRIKQKDELIKKKDEEYERLKLVLTDMQSEYDTLIEVNQNYLTIITNLQAMHETKTPRNLVMEREAAILDMKSALNEAQQKIESLRVELHDLDIKSKDAQHAYDQLSTKELKYRRMLGISDDDTQNESIEQRIKDLLETGAMQKNDLEKLRNELGKVKESRQKAEEKLIMINREKDHIAFYMRQQEMTMRRMKRQSVAKPTLTAVEKTLDRAKMDALKLPAIDNAGTTTSSRPSTSKSKLRYCLFCRTECDFNKSNNNNKNSSNSSSSSTTTTACRVHYKPLVKGNWGCCRDDCHRGAGCLQISHMYIELTEDRKVYLTDGARYIQLL